MNISRRSSSKRFRKASIYISRSSVANASTKNNLENATAPTLQVFVKDDPNEGKTFGRKIVEQYLHKMKWYNPQQSNISDDSSESLEKPSILRAWAFYEHFTLPRHEKTNSTKSHLCMAPSGIPERNTSLYSILNTRILDLESWGIAVVLYFNMLKLMSILLLLIGFINIPNTVYYGLGDYSRGKIFGSGGHSNMGGFSKLASGTAICTERAWVVCSDCDLDLWRDNFDESSTQENFGLSFVQRNTCKGITEINGKINLASLFFLIIGFFIIAYLQNKIAIMADEGKVSTSDYSICVKNPPPDAKDPDKWRDFFAQFDSHKPPLVTIALNNRVLLRALKELRILSQNLEQKRKVQMEEKIGPVRRLIQKLKNPMSEENILSKIEEAKEEIKNLQNQKYNVDRVYVTMETEKGQRNAIEALSASKLAIWKNDKTMKLFDGHILHASAALEPTQIDWMDVSIKRRKMIGARLISVLFIVAIVMLQFPIFREIRRRWGLIATIVVVRIVNALAPAIAKVLVSSIEFHPDEESKQISILTKITFLRWVATTLIWIYITPSTKYLQGGQRDFIPTVFIFFGVEAALPVIKAFNFRGKIQMHLRAPKAKTQREMNSFFKGNAFSVGERYADMTKIMFASFVLSAIWPSSFLAGGAALIAQFWADKYSLLRVWSISPDVGPRLSTANYFFIGLTIVGFASFSHWFWWGFPFDNLCEDKEVLLSDIFQVPSDSFGQLKDLSVEVYKYCDQRFRWAEFPPLPSYYDVEWMTDLQYELTSTYGVVVIIVFLGFFVITGSYLIYSLFFAIFRGPSKPDTQDQQMDFSSLYRSASILAYIPQIEVPGLDYNCFSCDIDSLDEDLIGWIDPHRTFDHYNLLYDVPHEGSIRTGIYEKKDYNIIAMSLRNTSTQDGCDPIFSIVKHWPRFPPKRNVEQEE